MCEVRWANEGRLPGLQVWLTSQNLGQAWQTLGLAGLRGGVDSRGGEACAGNGLAQEVRLPNLVPTRLMVARKPLLMVVMDWSFTWGMFSFLRLGRIGH